MANEPLHFYGFILPSVVVADHGVESLGRPNSVAYTAAGNPVLAAHPDNVNQSFQVAQSRLGVKAQSSENVFGLLEFDFVDFNKSTPTVAALTRLRRAVVNFKSDDWTFNFGQDWDLFSPLAPYSYNYVGHYFGSGDLGFMRVQMQAMYKSGDWEHAFAIGFPTNNNTFQQNLPEYSVMPTISWRETLTLGDSSLGFSSIYTRLNDKTNDVKLDPWAVNLFFKHKGADYEFNSEAYLGQNLDNISLLGLSYSSSLKSVPEAGGFVSFRQKWNDRNGYFLGLGYAKVLSEDNLQASYSYSAGKPVLNMVSSTSTGYGIIQNATARAGYEYYFSDKLSLFVETAFLYTQHKLDVADQGNVSAFVHAQVFELGAKLDL